MPVLLALLAIWDTDFFGTQNVAILPYEQYLKRLPAYLQQLIMESNGKSVTLEGRPVARDTSPVYWGEPGTNGRKEGTPDWLVLTGCSKAIAPRICSNMIVAERLTPETLGNLVALYEHITFTQGVIWGIDSFDQWGRLWTAA